MMNHTYDFHRKILYTILWIIEAKFLTYDGVIGSPEDSSDCQNSKMEYDLHESKFEKYFEFEDPP